jgi:iron-sulfur cluster assembly protein
LNKPFLPGKYAVKEGEGMVTLTPVAIAKVKSLIKERKEESSLRIAVVGGGCSGFQYQMTLDKESRSDDKILDLDGLKVFIDKNSLLYLDGTKIDYVDGQDGSGFQFDNPNAKTSCGCGETFEA